MMNSPSTVFALRPLARRSTTLWLVTSIALLCCAAASFGAHVNLYAGEVPLDARQEVPPPVDAASSRGTCTTLLTDSTLRMVCTHNVADATAAHIHAGRRGVAGPVVFPLGDGASPIVFEADLDPEQEATLLVDGFYVNIHTPENPAGEIRGQLVLDAQEDATDFRFSGTGDEGFRADCRAILSDRTGESDVRVICTHDLEDAVSAQFGLLDFLAPGGDPVIGRFDSAASPLDQVFTLPSAFGSGGLIRSGNTGVSLLVGDPGPVVLEARVLPCWKNDSTLCLQDRFRVSVDGEAPIGDGTQSFEGTAIHRTPLAGEFSFFNVANLEMLVKVLDGCSINGHYWVYASATTDVAFDLEVTDAVTGVSRTYSNPLGQLAAPIADTQAFDVCDGTSSVVSTRSFEDTWSALESAIAASPMMQVGTIDHAAGAASAGLELEPTRVAYAAAPALDAVLLEESARALVDLPHRFLVWQEGDTVRVGYNAMAYVRTRHGIPSSETTDALDAILRDIVGAATGASGIDSSTSSNASQFDPPGVESRLVTGSAADAEARLRSAVESASPSVLLEVDYQALAASAGVDLAARKLLLVGNPNIGTQLMQAERSIGIDLPLPFALADEGSGNVRVYANDIRDIADRHGIEGEDEVLSMVEMAISNFLDAAASP